MFHLSPKGWTESLVALAATPPNRRKPMASISPSAGAPGTTNDGKSYTPALVALTSLFFIWGFMT